MNTQQRGYVEIRLGGHTRTLRFRSHEICVLEERVGLGITRILSEDLIGIRVLREAILVGVAHEFAGKRGKEAKLSPQKVSRWIDQYGEDGGDLGELMKLVFEALALGLPGGSDAMTDDDDLDEGNGVSPPLVRAAGS